MSQPDCYSKRLLNPFSGVMQVVELDDARAVSSNGVNWSIQIRSDIYQTPWNELAIRATEPQYYQYGVWSAEEGLVKLPIHPTLYREHVESLAGNLLTSLQAMARHTPFSFRDQYELWLLDRQDNMPVALIATETRQEDIKLRQQLTWHPCLPDESGFQSTAFAEQLTRTTAPLHAHDLLTSMLRTHCGANPAAAWVQRHKDGSGTVLHDHRGKSVMPVQQLSQQQFPALLLSEQWPDREQQQLVDDYHLWQAPRLLTLSNLSRQCRKLLELSASQRPLLVHQLHRLYPEIIDQAVINKILVEAVMRRGLAQ